MGTSIPDHQELRRSFRKLLCKVLINTENGFKYFSRNFRKLPSEVSRTYVGCPKKTLERSDNSEWHCQWKRPINFWDNFRENYEKPENFTGEHQTPERIDLKIGLQKVFQSVGRELNETVNLSRKLKELSEFPLDVPGTSLRSHVNFR